MPRVAFSSLAVFRDDLAEADLQDFRERLKFGHALAASAPGFIQLVAEKNGWEEPHAPFVKPEQHKMGVIQHLFLWTHLEPVFAFAYRGFHSEALQDRRKWFIEHDGPGYVLWWVADEHVPDWQETFERFIHLHKHGPTAYAFDFMQPFDASGHPTQINHEAVNAYAAAFNP